MPARLVDLKRASALTQGVVPLGSPPRPPYRFASHVHACKAGRDLVMLDLKQDRYFGIDPADAREIAPLIAGFPSVIGLHDDEAAGAPADACPLLVELLENGTLEQNREALENTARGSLPRPEAALIDGYADIDFKVRALDVLHVTSSVVLAAALMRWCSLSRIIAHVTAASRHAGRRPFDVELARKRIAAFNRVRPFFYTSAEACLFSSLAMRSFLAHDRLVPKFVFGVSTRPFHAHSWLQHGDIVLNDTPEHVREFTPILII